MTESEIKNQIEDCKNSLEHYLSRSKRGDCSFSFKSKCEPLLDKGIDILENAIGRLSIEDTCKFRMYLSSYNSRFIESRIDILGQKEIAIDCDDPNINLN